MEKTQMPSLESSFPWEKGIEGSSWLDHAARGLTNQQHSIRLRYPIFCPSWPFSMRLHFFARVGVGNPDKLATSVFTRVAKWGGAVGWSSQLPANLKPALRWDRTFVWAPSSSSMEVQNFFFFFSVAKYCFINGISKSHPYHPPQLNAHPFL